MKRAGGMGAGGKANLAGEQFPTLGAAMQQQAASAPASRSTISGVGASSSAGAADGKWRPSAARSSAARGARQEPAFGGFDNPRVQSESSGGYGGRDSGGGYRGEGAGRFGGGRGGGYGDRGQGGYGGGDRGQGGYGGGDRGYGGGDRGQGGYGRDRPADYQDRGFQPDKRQSASDRAGMTPNQWRK